MMKLIGSLLALLSVLTSVCDADDPAGKDHRFEVVKKPKFYEFAGVHISTGEVFKGKESMGHTVQLDIGGYGISLGRSMKKDDAYEIGLLVDQGEGRGKKMGEIILPAFIGFKLAGVMTLLLAGMGTFVLKALGLAKIAFILSGILLLPKIFGHYQVVPKHVSYEAHSSEAHPIYAEFPDSAPAHVLMSGEGAPFVAYANYEPSAHEVIAESAANYAVVEAPANMTAITGSVGKRHDAAGTVRRKSQIVAASPLVTVRKYTIETK